MTEFLKKEAGYITFIYPASSFYIKTSFNPDICLVKPGFFYDMETGRFVPKSLIQGVTQRVSSEEPTHLKHQSDFWKSILLEGTHA